MRYLITLMPILFSAVVFGSPLKIQLPDQSVIYTDTETLLSDFETETFETHLPWFEDARQFTGIPVIELIERYGDKNTFAVTFSALNDYRATSTIEDINNYQPIIALSMNNEPMKIRHKGPFWMIYNLDKYPEIDNATYHSQMVWQIDEIVIYSNSNDQ
ncbi:hypothetical protein OTK51_14205 [Vibrio scophthalmi]|uniref:Oxidoreductase molybdopterin-binding domain-containing protein n=1 Tax=Vibrio scophthalmi TaxID=45658 RepID=A0A1E3WGL4_9VIBR|nr:MULTISPECIES: hypothetical protein [Vibrio]EGU32845.1 hypothetical protein VIBRN418_10198 [Vibrio sp. N418]MCY9804583.1 hypothetical protein [Vibrio scophthalmi]ODS04948.1 hypothetical protein VSF3289_04088 [Vibrio scophthalmi]